MKLHAVILVFLVSVSTVSFAQDVNELIADGNDFYRKQQWVKAELQYKKALEVSPANREAKFNLANTLLKQNRNAEAEKLLTELNNEQSDPPFRSKVNYNSGVKLTTEKKLEESIEAYKDALRLKPSDTSARENLQKALFELKKKQPPPKKEEPKPKKNQDQKKQNQQQQKMSQKEAEQRLQMMEQKEKQVLQRMQSEKSKSAANTVAKDW